MAEIEYVILERITNADPSDDSEFWREINRVTASRKTIVLRDHTPEQGVFNAIPASDWDAAVEVGTEQVPKRTVKPVKARPKRRREKPAEPVEA
jgi:hypothetical protein